jgi:tetratricopeptide (TPR) repeat protein
MEPLDPQQPHLFSPEHWDLILRSAEQDAAALPRRNRQAEQLWIAGHDAWHAENSPRAGELFRAAVEEAPGLADGYLGLFALSHGFDEAICQALAVTAERLGEYQVRFDKPLRAYYFPLYFESVAIESPDDARLALVRYLAKTQQFTAATTWLERCRPQDTRTLALAGRLALDEGRLEDAVSHLQQVAALDEELRGDAHLGLGIALAGMGLLDGAAVSLQASIDTTRHEHAKRYARYRLALVFDDSGRQRDARQLLEHLYSQDAGYRDVAQRLGLDRLPDSSTLADPWADIVAELESGRVTTDPSIHDNN